MAPPPASSDPVLNLIFTAASNGDLPRFNSGDALLDMGRGRLREAVETLRVNDEGSRWKGVSALHVAATMGRLGICRYLVEELRVDVNAVDEKGRTPLFMTTVCNNVDCATLFLDHGANPDKSCHGYCELVELFLSKGAYVDPVAYCGTPLHVAASKEQDGAMKILLDHNADVNKMVNGKTPIMVAIDASSWKCSYLLYKAGADRKGTLAYAAENLQASNVISSDFAKHILEAADTNCVVPCIFPCDEPVFKRQTIGGLKTVASYAFKRNDFESAERHYSQMIALDPDDATTFSNRSLCWLLMGDGGKALSDADECRRRSPDWPKACYRQGAALMLLKDYQGPCERFSDGLKLDPGSAEFEDALRKASEAQKMS